MPDTYTKVRYHLVFSTKNRAPLITDEVREELYAYLGGILRGNGGILLVVGGMQDHVHLLEGWKASISLSKMMQLIKANSSKWMNERPDMTQGSFAWQAGYGAFFGECVEGAGRAKVHPLSRRAPPESVVP
jgi:putative transposase